MSAPDIPALLSGGSCFQCLPPATRRALRLALLANWLPLPAKLSNVAGWYRPYVTTTVTQDTTPRVIQLNDVSGNSRSLITSTANGFQLNAANAGSNNLAYLTNHSALVGPFATANFALVQPCTIYVLARFTATQGALSGHLTDGLSNVSAGIIMTANASTVSLNNVGAFNTALPGGLNAWAVFTAIFNGASSFFQINRVAGITGNAGSTNPGGLTLGSRSDGGRTPTGADVLEAIVNTGADDAATRDALQLYLASKVGLSI